MSILFLSVTVATYAISAPHLQEFNALLNHTLWGVHGYSTQSAKELLHCVLTEE